MKVGSKEAQNNCETTAKPLRNHRETTAKPPRNHCETIAKPWRNHCETTAKPRFHKVSQWFRIGIIYKDVKQRILTVRNHLWFRICQKMQFIRFKRGNCLETHLNLLKAIKYSL